MEGNLERAIIEFQEKGIGRKKGNLTLNNLGEMSNQSNDDSFKIISFIGYAWSQGRNTTPNQFGKLINCSIEEIGEALKRTGIGIHSSESFVYDSGKEIHYSGKNNEESIIISQSNFRNRPRMYRVDFYFTELRKDVTYDKMIVAATLYHNGMKKRGFLEIHPNRTDKDGIDRGLCNIHTTLSYTNKGNLDLSGVNFDYEPPKPISEALPLVPILKTFRDINI